MTRIPFATAALALLALTACQDGPTRPEPGVLTLSLTTAADDRAVIVSVQGPEAMDRVEAANAAYAVHSRGTGTSFRAAVFGRLASGPLLRFAVPDVNKATSYTATVVEMADASNQLRAGTAPTVTISR
jgi:hypothetical protein